MNPAVCVDVVCPDRVSPFSVAVNAVWSSQLPLMTASENVIRHAPSGVMTLQTPPSVPNLDVNVIVRVATSSPGSGWRTTTVPGVSLSGQPSPSSCCRCTFVPWMVIGDSDRSTRSRDTMYVQFGPCGVLSSGSRSVASATVGLMKSVPSEYQWELLNVISQVPSSPVTDGTPASLPLWPPSPLPGL